MVNKPLIRPDFWGGGTLGGGWLTSHKWMPFFASFFEGLKVIAAIGGSYEAYLKSMAMDGTWGDHVTLQVGIGDTKIDGFGMHL